MGSINKARYWCGVLYTENMIDNWVNDIGDILQLPYSYCIHNKDYDDNNVIRKEHIHLIIAFPNTTTYKHAYNVFDLLSKKGFSALNKIEAVLNIRNMYEYLIHNTETCFKKGKHLYDTSERICGNLFDIGVYEQISIVEKNDICKSLCSIIKNEGFTNFIDFFDYVMTSFEYDSIYFEILKTNSGFFERLTKGNYLKKFGKML